MRVIVDTSPLIALERIGQLELLRALYDNVVRPQSVLDELNRGAERYQISSILINAEWIITEPDPVEMALRRELGAGETAAITLAYKSHADLIILDDLQARLVADAMGLRCTGTLGVLLAANHKNFLPDIALAIQKLQQCGVRISDTLLQKMSDLANRR